MQRDMLDLVWGGALALLGLAVAAYAAMNYDMGTPRQMGPGFFPVGLGIALLGFGLVIAIPAWWRAGKPASFAWRETLAISIALLGFAVMLDRLGIVISAFVTVLIAASVAPHKGIAWRLVVAAAITALTWAIFILGLKMPIPVWPRGL